MCGLRLEVRERHTPCSVRSVWLQDSECLSTSCTEPYVRITNCSLGHTCESSIARELLTATTQDSCAFRLSPHTACRDKVCGHGGSGGSGGR